MSPSDYISLLKILVEWSMKSEEYELSYFIYKNFNIGIPNYLLYKLPTNNVFDSLSSFVENNENIRNDDEILQELFCCFKKSKYTKLQYWDKYGYIIKL